MLSVIVRYPRENHVFRRPPSARAPDSQAWKCGTFPERSGAALPEKERRVPAAGPPNRAAHACLLTRPAEAFAVGCLRSQNWPTTPMREPRAHMSEDVSDGEGICARRETPARA